ncbi:MAG: glycosyltransferase [Bacteroidales bacterium]|nr:glycosyltransferase [Bacteroidales bacterium]
MNILQINESVNTGSSGRIAEEISNLLSEQMHNSIIAYGRSNNKSRSDLIKIGNTLNILSHVLNTRLFDRHGFGSVKSTERLVEKIGLFNPDLIHLHNLHGYYINIKVLFGFIKKNNIPIIWSLHDCWSFTGHCSHFQFVNCYKWQTGCFECPLKYGYPESWFIDNSKNNYQRKKELFTGVKKMILVSPSQWLAGHLRKSFLSDYEIRVINNGVDLDKFRPCSNVKVREKYCIGGKYIFGAASRWTKRKGLKDFIELREILDPCIDIVLAGLSAKQIKSLPTGIKAIPRTENIDELAALYSGAEVFLNPTYVDNFPTVNLEALACGTPVITYNTGGSPESIDDLTGIVVDKGDIGGLKNAVMNVLNSNDKYTPDLCRKRAEEKFSAKERFTDYLNLYKELVEK